MTSAAYQYLSDDGNIYQTQLDSEFAGVLGYVPASGSEPYLPAYISMRYASYKTATGLLLNAVYITQPFGPINPPQFFSIDGVSYFYASSYGEQRGFSQSPTIVTIAGPPGPPGSGGGGGVTSIAAGTGISVSSPTGAVTVTNTGVSSFAPSFTSSNIVFNLGNTTTVGHGLGRLPYFADILLVCDTASAGYTAGEEIPMNLLPVWAGLSSGATFGPIASLSYNSTDLFVNFVISGFDYWINNKNGGGQTQITAADFHLLARAW